MFRRFNSPKSLSRQVSYLASVLAVSLFVLLAGFGWWAASNIDDRSIARETRAIREGLFESTQRIIVEQDSAVVWDDAVINLRNGNQPWVADNLGEWISAYYGHDLVYVLDAHNQPVHAVRGGERIENASYDHDRIAVGRLVLKLRDRMAAVSHGLSDSTPAVTGLGVNDIVALGDGTAAIVSVRPVLPSSEAVTQVPGSEFLHVSIRLLGPEIAAEIADKYEVHALAFELAAQTDGERIAMPVLNNDRRIVGFFTWYPDEPAYQLIRDTAPALGGGVAMVVLGVSLLLRRLRRTSSQLEDSKAHASYLAFHDPLTGIPNRALFEERLDRALVSMRHTGRAFALHYVDLDRFKHVNDTLGHPAGDELIREAARRLSALVDEVDTVARLGGDEFAVIQTTVSNPEAAIALSQQIVDGLERPFELSGSEARVSASVGVVTTSDPQALAVELMRQADIALYEAKDNGRGRYQLFAGALDEAVRERRALEVDLRAALAGNAGLTLVYQPIYRASTGTVAGAEALVRWEHPTRGRLSPASFVALAEERGLIDQLGLWVLGEACRYAVTSSLPWVAVNVSPLQFRDDRFAERVFETLEASGLEPRRLEIEITEGLLLQNSPAVQATLMRLRARGIRVALDDFGTGYSSISYLRFHGVDKLKIDQSFTAQLGKDSEIDNIVQSIINLARAMHMVVTAEGVETDEQRRLLDAMGCDQLQGYLLSRPVLADELDRRLAALLAPVQDVG